LHVIIRNEIGLIMSQPNPPTTSEALPDKPAGAAQKPALNAESGSAGVWGRTLEWMKKNKLATACLFLAGCCVAALAGPLIAPALPLIAACAVAGAIVVGAGYLAYKAGEALVNGVSSMFSRRKKDQTQYQEPEQPSLTLQPETKLENGVSNTSEKTRTQSMYKKIMGCLGSPAQTQTSNTTKGPTATPLVTRGR
jgi:hypothetical protein